LPLLVPRAVEKLQKSKISDPLEIAGRWWLVRLEDTRPTKVPSYEQDARDIRRAHGCARGRAGTNELLQRLLKSAKVSQ
jgi:parvulin-like peptidyl-prolyl isomerase